MNKNLLLIILTPMALMSMQEPVDPDTIHSPYEKHMFKQATGLAWKRTTDNLEAIVTTIGSSCTWLWSLGTANTTVAAGAPALTELLTIAEVEMGAHAIDGLATSLTANTFTTTVATAAVADPEPISKTVIVIGFVAAVAATKMAKETWGWGWDVKEVYDKKQAFLEYKQNAKVTYLAFQEVRQKHKDYIQQIEEQVHSVDFIS
jgi:hypothetical protein